MFPGRAAHLPSWRRTRSGWAAGEELLQHRLADVVVVSSSEYEEERLEPMRRLVQQAIPTIAAHPVVVSLLLYYELDMIRRETDCPLLAFSPSRWHPATKRLVELASDDGPFAGSNQLVIERAIVDPSLQPTIEAFIFDVALARTICGDLDRIVAMSPGSDGDYRNLGVQLSGAHGSMVQWSAVAANDDHGATVTLRAATGSAKLTAPDDLTAWSLQWHTPQQDHNETFAEFDAAEEAIGRIEQMIAGTRQGSEWAVAAQDVEIAASIERSLKKGRTVELFAEDYSEEGTFKGTMAWVGCALLMLVALMVLAAGIAEELGMPMAHYIPHLAFGLLATFLVLQTLRLVFSGQSPATPAPRAPDSDPTDASASEAEPTRQDA